MSPSEHIPIESSTPALRKTAIKGFSLSSKTSSKPLSFATKPKPTPSSTLGKRPRSALHHESDESDDERPVHHEEVTGFDIREGGALRKGEEKPGVGPLVIPKMKNRDWRDEIRRGRQGRNLLPPEIQAQRAGKGVTEVIDGGGSEPQWGLTITKKDEGKADGKPLVPVAVDMQIENTEVATEIPKELTEDQRAIEALMGVKAERKGPDLVIASTVVDEEDARSFAPASEEDAYRRAIRAAPDVSTLEDYERVPVEEFGAALLRGMGWKEGDAKKGRVERPKDVKRRQNLLGLGATELKGAEELGAWVQKSDPNRLGSGGGRGDRKPKPNEYREREEKKRESRDERYGGSHRRDRDEYRDRDRDRRR